MATKILLRRGSSEDRLKFIFEPGELVYDTKLNALYIGDGKTKGGLLIRNGQGTLAAHIFENLKLRKDSNGSKLLVDDWEKLL